ncbi:hypothetical protein CR983_02760 [Candidatus Saccharibacteria bacterium]|nr:MAG: hypothetical protein CR983_02760 [Candidatus Saccharibacteria bacterium]
MKRSVCVIDGQVFQSRAWDRGMGKYSISLIKSLAAHPGFRYDEVILLFSRNLPLSKEVERAVKAAVPHCRIERLALRHPGDIDTESIDEPMRVNQERLTAFVRGLEAAETVDFMILSLFLDQVCSVFPTAVSRNILLFYDLIPLQYHERYGVFGNYDNYLRRFRVIFAADILWTISQTVADDVALFLGINPSKIHNIDGAAMQRSGLKATKPSFSIPERYILMPSGDDLRKNNTRMLQAVEVYNNHHNDSLAVLVTSHFSEGTQQALQAVCSHVQFTGNVSESELVWLYEHTELVLFAPEYEGLGMPVLEAAEYDKPVVTSNLTVFDEMSTTAFYSVDHEDVASIADGINHAVAKKGWSKKRMQYKKLFREYTWDNTADKALQSLAAHDRIVAAHDHKPKLAIFTPDPGGYSAIGKFNQLLHSAMAELFDIDYYVEYSKKPLELRPNYLQYIANVYDAEEFSAATYRQYDGVIYHIGNSEFHELTTLNALYLPGIAIFHDSRLEGLFGVMLADNYISQERYDAERLLNSKLRTDYSQFVGSVANRQLAAICHSTSSQADLGKETKSSAVSITRLNLPTATPQLLRRKLDRMLTVAFAGIIAPTKGTSLIESIAAVADEEDFYIDVFGVPLLPAEELTRMMQLPRVTITTDLSDFAFMKRLAKADILVSYRPSYNGESSAAVIEAMRFGVVPIVRDIGWFRDLDDDAVIKVQEQIEVLTQIRALNRDRQLLERVSQAAKSLMAQQYSYTQYARGIRQTLLQVKTDSTAGKLRAKLLSGAKKATLLDVLDDSNRSV